MEIATTEEKKRMGEDYMKKIPSLFLIVLLIHLQWGNITVYGASAVHSEVDFETQTNSTGVTITKYKGTAKDITIPDKINNQAVMIPKDVGSFQRLAVGASTSLDVRLEVPSTSVYGSSVQINASVNEFVPGAVIKLYDGNTLLDSTEILSSEPIIKNRSQYDAPAVAGANLICATCSSGYTTVDTIEWNGLTYWTFSYSANTEYTKLVAVDSMNRIVKVWENVAPVRYVGEMILEANGTITLKGQGTSPNNYQPYNLNLDNYAYSSTSFAITNLALGDHQLRIEYTRDGNAIDGSSLTTAHTVVSPASMPTANPPSGVVTSGTTVELSTSTAGATIYYTTDGSTPSNTSIPYTSPISVTSNITIKAIAVKAGTPDSQVMSESYTIMPAETPTANIRGGTVTSGTTITLSTATVGATIYYTTDGSTPSNTSTPYTSPISVTSNITIKAIAVKTGTPDSQVMSESYTIMPAETPTANIRGGTVTSGTTITLSTATVGATIYYTTDGSTPSNTSTPYTSPISVTSDMTIKAIAIKVGIPNSPIMSESYTLLPAGTLGLNPSPPSPSHQILIQRVVENGEISYLGNVTLENVQAIIQQLTSEKERVVGVIFPAEAANVDTTLTVQRAAVEYLAKQKVDLFIQLANATIRVPHTSLNDFTDNLFFRIAPIEQTERKVIEENAAQNQKVQDFITNKMSVNLLGDTVAIKTNLQSRPVIVTLPIPADATEEQIASLVVYIEHSNGTAEVKRGRIVEFEPGVKGFQFEVDHFSTFSLLYTSEVQDEEVNRLAPYIQGYPDGSFKPNAPVTRAQMATMLARFLTNGDIPTTMNSSFKDTIYHHSKDAIEVVKQTGLFNGTTETTFNPNGTITRAQMATVVTHWLETGCVKEPSKTICHVSGKAKSYTDVSSTHWAASAIEQVSESGIMTGNSETTFNPNGSLTRAQAVKVLNQLFERPVLEDIPMSTFSDVPSTHWAIGEIEAAATERIVNK